MSSNFLLLDAGVQCDYSGHIMPSGTRSVIKMGVREARTRFSEILHRVRHGVVVEVTDRGREVAQIIPFPSGRKSSEQRLKDLEEKGLLTLSNRKIRPREIRPVPARKGIDLQKILQEDRNGD